MLEAPRRGRVHRSGRPPSRTTAREIEQLQDVFGRLVGPEVARQALGRGFALGGESRDVAVLFVDLNGSTAYANGHTPDEVVALLNTFFGVVVDVIDQQGGMINKFVGDGALCIFGAPSPHPDPAGAALAAGRSLLRRIAELDDEHIGVCIGISAGAVVAGNIGAESRFEYTVTGDPVNEASRLTDLAKQRQERLLATLPVVSRAGPAEASRWRTGDALVLVGRREVTRLALPVEPG